jgi:hypothetical protein
MKPALRVTKDYDIFDLHVHNREIRTKAHLFRSMKQHGFMPSSPVQCVQEGSGRLQVIRGHHRILFARQLGLPVWYVVDDSNTDIYDLEADSSNSWKLRDFVVSYASAGLPAYAKILDFQREHGITQQIAINLLGGQGARSNNRLEQVKRGTFAIAEDLSHAHAVVDVVGHLRSGGVAFASQSNFVAALSSALRVPEFDAKLLKHRFTQAPGLLQPRTSMEGYLDEVEALYNHGAKGRRVPLKFRAREVARERQATFGGRITRARSKKGEDEAGQ